MDTNMALYACVLLRHKIPQHSTDELCQEHLPEYASDQDLKVAVMHLSANSRRRFESISWLCAEGCQTAPGRWRMYKNLVDNFMIIPKKHRCTNSF